MLEEVPSERNRRIVFRLSRVSANDDQFLAELNLDAEAHDELMSLLSSRIPQGPVEELLDGPFRTRARLRRKTRFSDGSFPVFYSALAAETGNAEMSYWFRKDYMGKPKSNRRAYFQRFHCTFEGLEKDLRCKAADWPNLVHDSDYSFCNQLGAEARDGDVDGLVVPSARHKGANMPIFARRAVNDPRLERIVAFTYNPESGVVSFEFISQD